jgi:hypothetical protein
MTRVLEEPLHKWLSGPALENLSEAEFEEAGGDGQRALRVRWMKQIETIVEPWGDSARTYVLEPKQSLPGAADHLFFEMQRRYSLAISIRDLLDTIAEQNATSPATNHFDRIYKLPYSVELLSTLSLRMARNDISESVVKERPRRAVLEPAEPLKRFLEEVELDRIKRCAYEKCRKIFWAGRIDRPCCSEICRNSYRQKKHRERKKENRRYNKRLLKRRTLK